MSPETKVNIAFGIIEALIGLATIAVGFASYLQARENRRRVPLAAMDATGPRMNKALAHKDTRTGVDKRMRKPHNAQDTRHHESGVSS
ncbi:MAG: hypothetical protein M1836_003895 [Candelina mexicana]|nr:MAG: hypothetical protein M1836_003895 [Candelina mexicana]